MPFSAAGLRADSRDGMPPPRARASCARRHQVTTPRCHRPTASAGGPPRVEVGLASAGPDMETRHTGQPGAAPTVPVVERSEAAPACDRCGSTSSTQAARPCSSSRAEPVSAPRQEDGVGATMAPGARASSTPRPGPTRAAAAARPARRSTDVAATVGAHQQRRARRLWLPAGTLRRVHGCRGRGRPSRGRAARPGSGHLGLEQPRGSWGPTRHGRGAPAGPVLRGMATGTAHQHEAAAGAARAGLVQPAPSSGRGVIPGRVAPPRARLLDDDEEPAPAVP